jgi:hypothetical protein
MFEFSKFEKGCIFSLQPPCDWYNFLMRVSFTIIFKEKPGHNESTQ